MPAKRTRKSDGSRPAASSKRSATPLHRERVESSPGSSAPSDSGRQSQGTGVVLKAASILEDELALGIGAAKRIERRFLNVDRLRSEPPDALLSRFRRDAHEVVEILVDVVGAAATTVSERAGQIVNIAATRVGRQAGSPAQAAPGAPSIPVVEVPGPVLGGSITETAVSFENESGESRAEFTMQSSDLVSGAGSRIAAEHVGFSPETMTIEPRRTGEIRITLRVPEGTPAGNYEGLLRSSRATSLRALLRVQVQ